MDPITLLFLAILVVVLAAFVLAVFRAGPDGGRLALFAAVGALAWLLLTGLVARGGLLADFDRPLPLLFPFLAGSTICCFALAFSRLGTRLVEGTGIAALVGFQVFRIPVELVLFGLHRDGRVPVQMTFEGLNFDILSGITALVVAVLAARGRLSSRVLLLWNLLGSALLLNIVTIAMLSTPTPIRLFLAEPANTIVTSLPYVWLPAVLVQAALLGHLLVFRKLRRMGDAPA